jgi:phosphatidylserine/phosphatidylglycerophosphate/cardiolipin synthase-like enzyme
MQAIIGNEFSQKVILLLDAAKSTIQIIVFDWRWYPNSIASPAQLFNQALVRAVKRGVIVQAVVNSDDIAAVLNKLGIAAKKAKTKNLLHAKQIVIDGKTLIIGSHNYSQAAMTTNYEASVIIEEMENPKPFLDLFNSLWQL